MSPTTTAQVGAGWKETYLGGSPEAEAQLVSRWAKEIQQFQRTLAARHKTPIGRVFHAKLLAGVQNAEWRVADDLPEHLRVGLFRPGAVYPATVRLSNVSGAVQRDSTPDFRGIAVRIVTDAPNVTDFLATTGAVSHARDAHQYMVAARATTGSRVMVVPKLLFGLGPVEMFRLLSRVRRGRGRPVSSMAAEQFWSRSAYKFGERAMRFTLTPAQGPPAGPPRQNADSFLREEFAERLKRGPVTYDFKVQFFVNEKTTSIEDASVEWPETVAPFVSIAKLILPQQDLLSPERQEAEAAIERLDFNPWHTTDELRPLGSINRARKRVYQSGQHLRAGRQPYIHESWFWSVFFGSLDVVFRVVNRLIPWDRLWTPLALLNLDVYRETLREKNLHDTEVREVVPTADPRIDTPDPKVLWARRPEGRQCGPR